MGAVESVRGGGGGSRGGYRLCLFLGAGEQWGLKSGWQGWGVRNVKFGAEMMDEAFYSVASISASFGFFSISDHFVPFDWIPNGQYKL